MKLSINEFTGIAPRQNPRYLPAGGSQQAINVEAFGSALRPIKGHGTELGSVTLNTGSKTIYRGDWGSSNSSQYWLSWTTEADVVRSQIAGDSHEWTFFTDNAANSYPKATQHGEINPDAPDALLSTPYPKEATRLGIPAPDGPLGGAITYAAREVLGASIKLTPSILASMTNWDFEDMWCPFRISLDNGTQWFFPTGLDAGGTPIGDLSAFSPVIQLSAADLAHFNVESGIRLSLDGWATERWATIASNSPADMVTALNAMTYKGQLMVDAEVYLTTGVQIKGRRSGAPVEMYIAYGADNYAQSYRGVGKAFTPEALQPYFLGRLMDVNNVGVTIVGDHYYDVTVSADDSLVITTNPYCFDPTTNTVDTVHTDQATCEATGVDHWWILNGENRHLTFLWGDNFQYQIHAQGSTENKGTAESRVYAFTWIADFGDFVWESDLSFPSAVANVFEDSTVHVLRRYAGYCQTTSAECKDIGGVWDGSHCHTSENLCTTKGKTWVNYDFSGTCSDAAYTNEATCLAANKTWTYTSATLPPPVINPPSNASTGYYVNGLRLYRATAGTYLLVAEGAVNETGVNSSSNNLYYNDTKKAADLLGPCLSIGWEPPISTLTGLVNLPNGMVAGFSGRDIYFCEPYRPYAWPSAYMQTVDYPVVGLGVIDTTLVVLTEGTPYFIQGTHPATMAAVKSDLKQACVSKRSIVSMSGSVIFASPDGLVMLSPGGSAVITDSLFKKSDWDSLSPETIIAFEHDGMYIAFHSAYTMADTNVAYGFILDAKTKQFIRHNIRIHHNDTVSNVTCGFSDLVNDSLYLSDGTRIVPFGEGSAMVGKWKSKLFSLPQMTGFSCAQLEAEDYPVSSPITMTILCDGDEVIADRVITGPDAFRLPPVMGRSFEVSLETSKEVFNIQIAQSMDEIATS